MSGEAAVADADSGGVATARCRRRGRRRRRRKAQLARRVGRQAFGGIAAAAACAAAALCTVEGRVGWTHTFRFMLDYLIRVVSWALIGP